MFTILKIYIPDDICKGIPLEWSFLILNRVAQNPIEELKFLLGYLDN